MHHNPYKSKNRRTVVGKAYHETQMQLMQNTIDELERKLKASERVNEINSQALESAEAALHYHSEKARRAEMIINRMVGYEKLD